MGITLPVQGAPLAPVVFASDSDSRAEIWTRPDAVSARLWSLWSPVPGLLTSYKPQKHLHLRHVAPRQPGRPESKVTRRQLAEVSLSSSPVFLLLLPTVSVGPVTVPAFLNWGRGGGG